MYVGGYSTPHPGPSRSRMKEIQASSRQTANTAIHFITSFCLTTSSQQCCSTPPRPQAYTCLPAAPGPGRGWPPTTALVLAPASRAEVRLGPRSSVAGAVLGGEKLTVAQRLRGPQPRPSHQSCHVTAWSLASYTDDLTIQWLLLAAGRSLHFITI